MYLIYELILGGPVVGVVIAGSGFPTVERF